jgi:hypothetical protein
MASWVQEDQLGAWSHLHLLQELGLVWLGAMQCLAESEQAPLGVQREAVAASVLPI